MSEEISKYLTYKEAVRTDVRNVANIPTADQLSAMRYVARRIFDPVREHVGSPLFASSFFRSGAVNRAIGGSSSSQHCKGEAIDIDCDMYGKGTNKQVFEYIRDNLVWDQMIWEFGTEENPSWVHVSLRRDNHNRKQILRAVKRNGKTVYENYAG
jgi:zinc D-Ala-D-Ala carboxypeptidase